ncbi:alpha-1,2-fucosyltransferase [Vibrio fluvialis]|uniref:alpha-1,2-fucosyltransferase n=1 Tax=Vibrio fluvialis TaxID=676 RepID=UPI003756E96D
MEGKKIVEIIGGLGNQMFQYALYLKLKKIYGDQNTYIYLGRFNDTEDNKGYQIGSYFTSCKSRVFTEDVSQYLDENLSLRSKVRRKIFGAKESFILEVDGKCKRDLSKLDTGKDYYIRGLWQSEEYFKEIGTDVRNSYSLHDELLDEKWLRLNCNIEGNKKIVSLHVRRGDYISNPKYNKILGGVCGKNYYKLAVEYIKNKFGSNVTFMVFSDDLSWVKKEYDFLKCEMVVYPSNDTDYEDLYFMSKCDAHIIANSTFSWWGAWLGENREKLVVAPKEWYRNKSSIDIVPSDWIRI